MMRVLKEKDQIQKSRLELEQNHESALSNHFARILWRLRLSKKPPVGDYIKSWDVNLTLRFIKENIPKKAAILDLGSFCSETPIALAQSGFENVHGIDLNPRLFDMPFSGKVKYRIGNFMNTFFEADSFEAITAISVIEHGYNPDLLFSELGRLIKSGGYFIASFDFWPEKIKTGNTNFFGLSWTIFSKEEVESMLKIADSHGFFPFGEIQIESQDRPIHCRGFNYTFAWMVLKKR